MGWIGEWSFTQMHHAAGAGADAAARSEID